MGPGQAEGKSGGNQITVNKRGEFLPRGIYRQLREEMGGKLRDDLVLQSEHGINAQLKMQWFCHRFPFVCPSFSPLLDTDLSYDLWEEAIPSKCSAGKLRAAPKSSHVEDLCAIFMAFLTCSTFQRLEQENTVTDGDWPQEIHPNFVQTALGSSAAAA